MRECTADGVSPLKGLTFLSSQRQPDVAVMTASNLRSKPNFAVFSSRSHSLRFEVTLSETRLKCINKTDLCYFINEEKDQEIK